MIIAYFKRKKEEARARLAEEKAQAEALAAKRYQIRFYDADDRVLAIKTTKGRMMESYLGGFHYYAITGESLLKDWVSQYELGYPTDQEDVLFNVHACAYHTITELKD